MRYEILGALRVVDDCGSRFISARKTGTLLAVLLIRANQVVPREQLITELWGDSPPRRVDAALHVYVSQLRKFLIRPGRPDSPIDTRAPGYLLRTGLDELDLDQFQRLVGDGRTHARAGRHQAVAASLEAALSLWRGPVLEGLRDGPVVSHFIAWLDELRLECWELLVSSYLALGRHHQLVSTLRALIIEHPLHEVFHCQLMLALYGCGRRAEALGVYSAVRKTLRAELGLEPSRPLQVLQQSILMDKDTDVAVPVAEPAGLVSLVRSRV
ncbi:BTAD domain-containing putative transcriptional regulator [Streptomyces sp. NPDC019531]|uniref:AfsR/SARP family transcriptional regulator n=1 Tax=Streptomyces sp. NPDC019531 TaxID=3365062 RepID=UPI00384FED50